MKTIIALVSIVFSTTAFAETIQCTFAAEDIHTLLEKTEFTKNNKLTLGMMIDCNRAEYDEKGTLIRVYEKDSTPVVFASDKHTFALTEQIERKSPIGEANNGFAFKYSGRAKMVIKVAKKHGMLIAQSWKWVELGSKDISALNVTEKTCTKNCNFAK